MTEGIIAPIIIILIMILLLAGLRWMQNKHYSFTVRVLSALVGGIVFGAILQLIFGLDSEVIVKSNNWISIVGNGYVRLLNMIVIPLVFVAISTAIINQKAEDLKKSAITILSVLLITTAIAAVVGAGTAKAFKLDSSELHIGEQESIRGEVLDDTLDTFKEKSIPEQITEIIPRNIFFAMTGESSSSTLSVVFFAAFLGIAIIGLRRKKPETAEAVTKFLNNLNTLVMRMVTLVLRLTPFGILALMTRFVATSDFIEIARLLKFVLASYVAILIMFLVHLIVISINGLNPIQYLRKSFGTLSFAFSSRSSAGAIPINVETQVNEFGVPKGIANLSASLGSSIGQNGCAGIYPAMLAVMIATGLGIPLNAAFFIKLILITTISSLGIAGVGGGATFAALTVLSSMGLPVGLVGLLIAIEPLIDMGRTALNVSGSMIAGIVTGKRSGEMDMEKYNKKEMSLEESN